MFLPDVNVLIYAHRPDSPEHGAYSQWLSETANRDEAFALSEQVLFGFVRLVTNGRIFREPTPIATALAFLDELARRPNCRIVRPGERHWPIFRALCSATGASGTFVADLFHAAVAIEHGCEWVTNDGDFARVPGLRWRHPLGPPGRLDR